MGRKASRTRDVDATAHKQAAGGAAAFQAELLEDSRLLVAAHCRHHIAAASQQLHETKADAAVQIQRARNTMPRVQAAGTWLHSVRSRTPMHLFHDETAQLAGGPEDEDGILWLRWLCTAAGWGASSGGRCQAHAFRSAGSQDKGSNRHT